MASVGSALERAYPATNDGVRPRLVPLAEQVLGPVRPVLLALLVGVLFLLAVACANVSNLQLAKLVARRNEIAIRLALGASRPRIFLTTLGEMWAWALGTAAALAVITYGFPFLSSLVGERPPRSLAAGADGATLGITLVAAAGTALGFGAPVAFFASRLSLGRTSHAGRGADTEAPSGRRQRSVLVVTQIASACALLVTSRLLSRSLVRLSEVPLGFEPDNVVVVRLALGDPYEDESRRIVYLRDSARQAARPARGEPCRRFHGDADEPLRHRFRRSLLPSRKSRARAGDRTQGAIPLRNARGFSRHRNAVPLRSGFHAGRPARHAPGGRREPRAREAARTRGAHGWHEYSILLGGLANVRGLGVVEDTRSYRIAEAPLPELFVPHSQNPYRVMNVAVKGSLPPETLAEAARALVSSLDPDEPAIGTAALPSLVAATTARENLAAHLLGLLSFTSLLLALGSVHSVLSFSTKRRTREIGIRMALGAAPGTLLAWALKEGVALTILGIALGLLVSAAGGGLLSELLFDVGPRDPFVFSSAPLLLFGLSMTASYFAVRAVVRVDPAEAFRSD